MQRFILSLAVIIPLLVCALPSKAQLWQNLDFSHKCDSSKTKLCSWELSWGDSIACRPEVIDGNQCLLIDNVKDGAVGFVEQSAQLEQKMGLATIQLSMRVRTDSVQGKGAGIVVSFYDSSGAFLTTKDMGYGTFNWIHGTTDWKQYSIAMVIPDDAAMVKIGAILYGKGRARYDDVEVAITPVSGRAGSKLAVDYISAACDSIKLHSLVRDSLNIDSLKKIAISIAGPAKTLQECHVAVEYLLTSLRNYGDHHSFLMKPNEVANWESDSTETAGIQYCVARVIDSCGYIMVPAFNGGNQKLMTSFCDSIQEAFRRLDTMNIKGWIIDLRLNTGGNMEPMLAGLGPIFDSEKLGSVIDVYGKAESWYYRNGVYYWEREALTKATNPVVLKKRRPVAVLLSPQTGSSGEAVAISFIGNGKTRSFGEHTWGLTTGNGSFDLPDGARMKLASTVMADRNGNRYENGVDPDVKIDPKSKPGGDAVLWGAEEWIEGEK
ncbi:MAG: S41 family peptidase [Candidatus Zixiibacteriota bacterium]